MINHPFFQKKIFKYSTYALILFGIERWCFKQTAGFRDYKVLSTLPIDPSYQTDPLSEERKNELFSILDQPFYYAGHGGTAYCFTSQDRKYAIKLFKHQHFNETPWYSQIKVPSFLKNTRDFFIQRNIRLKAHKRRDYLFKSFLLAQDRLKEETAIIHLQLNRDEDFGKSLVFFDKIGCKHEIALSQTEFVLQRRADMIFDHLLSLYRLEKFDQAKGCIDSLFSLLNKRLESGLEDRDPHLSINFGFVDDKAVEIDIGAFIENESMKERSIQTQEITKISSSLKKSLISLDMPKLAEYVDLKLKEIQ